MRIRNIRFDAATGEFVREERIKIDADITNTKDIEDAINYELAGIVRQVKALKRRCEELKAMKEALKGKAGPIDPAPEPVAHK